jgi:hypothetical protein
MADCGWRIVSDGKLAIASATGNQFPDPHSAIRNDAVALSFQA